MHQNTPSPRDERRDRRASVPIGFERKIHGTLLETLLSAASREDELISQLLDALGRDDRRRVVALATTITSNRSRNSGDGISPRADIPVTGDSVMPRNVAYQDKLLAAIYQEEILIEALVTAIAIGESAKLFRLCHDLDENRKCIHSTIKPKETIQPEPTP